MSRFGSAGVRAIFSEEWYFVRNYSFGATAVLDPLDPLDLKGGHGILDSGIRSDTWTVLVTWILLVA